MLSRFEQRLQRIREEMVEEGLDALFLMMSSDLQYLTGVLRQPYVATDEDKHGDELYGAFLTTELDPVFLVPRMSASEYVMSQAEGKPWIKDIVILNDGDDPLKLAQEMLHRLGKPRRMGVSGRAWARSLMRLQQAQPDLEFADASLPISRLRSIKDVDETRIMKETCERTDQVFAAVLQKLRIGMTEYEIANEVHYQIMSRGCVGLTFDAGVSIAGAGISRYEHRRTPIQPGAVITFDFGLMHDGYVSDFGRTVYVGEPNAELKRYHDAVMLSQAEAISAMKSGQLTAARLNEIARAVLDDAGLGCYFTHRLGHGIGIDVHEPPFLYEQDYTVLESGMCFTIEPSVRVPGVVGVRVEDIVQVTPTGGVSFNRFSRDYLII